MELYLSMNLVAFHMSSVIHCWHAKMTPARSVKNCRWVMMSTINLQRILIIIGLKTLILVMKTLAQYNPHCATDHQFEGLSHEKPAIVPL